MTPGRLAAKKTEETSQARKLAAAVTLPQNARAEMTERRRCTNEFLGVCSNQGFAGSVGACV